MAVTEIASAPRDRWLHTQEELMKFSASRKHMTYEQELTLRQKIGRWINGLADRLNANVEKQFYFRTMSICSAIVHVNRFFYVHSFRDIDLRDVCLAAVFLTAKSDDCPRSPRSILLAFWPMRFGVSKIPDKLYDAAVARMCFFETMLLQTIGFDLVLDMPHPHVLQQMAALDAGDLREAAYFFASDVLAYTDWSIRYTAAEIAAFVVYAVCIYANHPLPDMSVKQPWFQVLAPQLTEADLQINEHLINTLYEKLATTDRPRNVKDRIKAALEKKTAAAAAVEANGPPQNRKSPHDGS